MFDTMLGRDVAGNFFNASLVNAPDVESHAPAAPAVAGHTLSIAKSKAIDINRWFTGIHTVIVWLGHPSKGAACKAKRNCKNLKKRDRACDAVRKRWTGARQGALQGGDGQSTRPDRRVGHLRSGGDPHQERTRNWQRASPSSEK